MSRPSAAERLANPAAILSRRDLRELGWERRAVDAIFRQLDPVFVPDTRAPRSSSPITSARSSDGATTAARAFARRSGGQNGCDPQPQPAGRRGDGANGLCGAQTPRRSNTKK